MVRSSHLPVLGLVAILTAVAVPAGAQCLDFVDTLESYNCSSEPPPPGANAKSFESVVIGWGAKSFLFMSDGNELLIYDISTNPTAPTQVSGSGFDVPNLGDSDYDMLSFEVCDDCRFGIANFKLGTMIFDLGTDPTRPRFTSQRLYSEANDVKGGMAFTHGGKYYILANDLPSSCGGATLFEVTNSGGIQLQELGCFLVPGVQTQVLGGFKVGENHLYVGDRSGTVYIVEIQTFGSAIALQYLSDAPFTANQQRGKGFDIDETMGLLVSDSSDMWIDLYDLSGQYNGQASVTSPRRIARLGPPNSSFQLNRRVAIQHPLVYGSYQGTNIAPEIYDISNPLSPSGPLDPGFWDASNSWNDWDCRKDYDGAFHPSAGALYLARYQVAQVVNTADCSGPTAPTAAVTVSPPAIFPGTPTTITDTSAGTVERRAIWVTLGSVPTATPVAGSVTMATATTANKSLQFPIPATLALEATYYAHVAVDNQNYPCGASGTACPSEQIASRLITVDRTPTATISMSPAAPITGDTVTLTPVVEGTPTADPDAASAYEWTVTGPSGAVDVTPDALGRVTVSLSASGTWTYKVRVNYGHDAPTGTDLDDDSFYEFETTVQSVTVTSVSANFTMSPTIPLHTQTITLTSTSNAASGASLTFDWDVMSSDGSSLVHELSACDGVDQPVNDQCVIAGETLSPGTYDFVLNLTNASNGDQSQKILENVAIADGSIQISLTVNDSTPDIGQTVTFTINGVAASAVEQATWNFGGPSCDSATYPQTWTCTPGSAFNCGSAGYKYSTSGAKTASVTVRVSGQNFGPFTTSLSVNTTGSCGGTTSCTYSLSPSSRSYTADGGSGTFTVNTQTGCSWNATESESFIELVGSSSGTGSGSVSYAVLTNSSTSSRTGRIYAAGQTFTVTQSGVAPCSYTISPTTAIAEGGGGSGTIQVTAGSTCQWSAVSHAGWLRVTAGASGTGNGTVSWAADPNPYQVNRTGEIIIADNKTFTLTQYPVLPAEFTVSNPSPDKGEFVTFTVDSRLNVTRWNFGDDGSMGGRNCLDEGPIFNCAGLPESVCETIRWNWPDRGPKYVTMTLSDGRSSTQRLSVQSEGECPCVLEPPATSFEMTPNPVYAMEEVAFTDTTPGTPGGSQKILATIGYTPASPEIGERVSFTLSGIGEIDRADWTFGAAGCDGTTSQQCLGDWCSYGTTFHYASSGTFTVRVTTYLNGTQTGTGTTTVTVQPTGSCGGTTCSYAVSPTASSTFPATGGSGSFAVSTNTPSCAWTASSNSTWVHVTGGSSGAGAGTVAYSVDPNTGAARTGSISVQGKQHTITQAAASGGCTYGVSPSSSPTFAATGGTGAFTVTTSESSCAWTATSNSTWIRFSGASSGTGVGTVAYTVDANTGPARTGTITVQGWQHVVTQAEAADGGPPETWAWRVTLDGVEQITSDQPSFAWTPRRAGAYQVSLTTSNCGGSTTLTRNLEVLPPLIPPIEEYVVPSAVHTRGENDTLWKTDLRIFNPCSSSIMVDMRYLPEATNNNGSFLLGREFTLAPNGTKLFNDVIEAIPGVVGDDNKGSLRISFDAPESCLPMIMSRTYNDTPDGTFGQYVPAVPVLPAQGDRMFLTGLAHNLYYRTNLGFANFTDQDVTLQVQLLDERGDPIGDPVYPTVPAFSTRQVLRVAERANLFTDLNAFSAEVTTGGADVAGYASVVDNITGDPVYFSPTVGEDTMLWLPGVAHLTGLNDSRWRTDVTFFNAFDIPDTSRLDYYPEDGEDDHFFLEFLGIEPGESFYFVDILDFMLGDVQSKGYFTLRSLDGNPVPRVAARTYNLDAAGGTFGQNLLAFGENDLIAEGGVAFIPGVANSASASAGFRTNLGVINTDPNSWLSLRVTVYGEDGAVAGQRESWSIEPGQSRQPNLFQLVGLTGVEMEGSVEIEVLSGGPAVIFVSEIDNRTQDPIFIPAIPDPTAVE